MVPHCVCFTGELSIIDKYSLSMVSHLNEFLCHLTRKPLYSTHQFSEEAECPNHNSPCAAPRPGTWPMRSRGARVSQSTSSSKSRWNGTISSFASKQAPIHSTLYGNSPLKVDVPCRRGQPPPTTISMTRTGCQSDFSRHVSSRRNHA